MWWNFTKISLNSAGQVRYNRRLALFRCSVSYCLIMSVANYQALKRSNEKGHFLFLFGFARSPFFVRLVAQLANEQNQIKIKNNKDSTLFGGLFALAKSVTKSVRPTPIYSHWSALFKLIFVFIPPHTTLLTGSSPCGSKK